MKALGPVVDAAFPIRGASLPLDHGYTLFGALSRMVPALHQNASWGVHPVYGTQTAPGVLSLNRMSWLKIRIPAADLGALLPLAGKSLEVGGHKIELSVPRMLPLIPAAQLKARFVSVKKFHEEPGPFLDALRRQVAAIEGLGQDPERIEIAVPTKSGDGKEEPLRRVMVIAGKKVVGFAVTLSGLEASASIAIQETGLGGRRHMGAGIFVPPGKRE
jgi:CRISPR-associated protein Cas6